MSSVISWDLSDPNLKTKLASLPKDMADWAEEVLLSRAELMRGLAQVMVLVDTGSLRDSIRVERGGIGMYWREVRVRAGGYITNPKTNRLVDYALYVELRQPFMQPAWEAVKDDIERMIRANVVDRANAETETGGGMELTGEQEPGSESAGGSEPPGGSE